MRRIGFLVLLFAVTLTTGVKWGSVQSATRGADSLDLLPDGGGVAVIDFQRIAGSSLWAALSTQDKFKSTIDKLQSEIGDLGVKLSDVHMVALSFPTSDMNSPTIAITGSFEQNDLLARLRNSSKIKLTSERYKNYDIYTARSIPNVAPPKDGTTGKPAPAAESGRAGESHDETSFVFKDATTVVTGNPRAVRASIDVMTGARQSITRNAKLMEALAQNSTAAVRFALTITPAMASGLQSSELPIPDFSSIALVFGSVDVSSGIDVNITLRNDTAEHAGSLAERLNGLLGMVKGFVGVMTDPKTASILEALKTFNISQADVDVRITGNVPMDLLTSLLSSNPKKAQ